MSEVEEPFISNELSFERKNQSEKARLNTSAANLNQSYRQWKEAEKNVGNDYTDFAGLNIRFIMILIFQELIALGLCLLISYDYLPIKEFIKSNSIVFVIIFIIAVLLSVSAYITKKHLRERPSNLIFLTLYTLAFCYILSFMCVTTNESLFIMSIFMTFIVTIVLVIYLVSISRNFSVLGSCLSVLFTGIIYYLIFIGYTNFTHVLVLISLIWVLFWGFYLVFWIWLIKEKILKKLAKKELKTVHNKDFILTSFRFHIIVLFVLSLLYAFRQQEIEFLNQFGV